MVPAYFRDMEIVDERLTKLEEKYDNITKLLEDIQRILEVKDGIKEETKQER